MVVTDNDSRDDSVPRLLAAVGEQGWREWVTIEPLERNGGFAYGNNAAIRPALSSSQPPDYIWLLNPDTVVRPGALGALIHVSRHPSGSRHRRLAAARRGRGAGMVGVPLSLRARRAGKRGTARSTFQAPGSLGPFPPCSA